MKKIILFAAAAVAISFASCGNKSAVQETTDAVQEATETVVEQVETIADTTIATVDSLVNEVKEVK